MVRCFIHYGSFQMGIKRYLSFDTYGKHIGIFGTTGSGKSYASKLLLAKIVQGDPQAVLYIGDFKGDTDFQFLGTHSSFFKFDDFSKLFELGHRILLDRRSGIDNSRNATILYFDEYSNFLLSIQDKKTREYYESIMSALLNMGRSFGISVIISQQRPDAEFFGKSRDNLNIVINLGFISKEVKSMLFQHDEVLPNLQRGHGYIKIDGRTEQIIVPRYDIEFTNSIIVETIKRK